MNVIIRLLFLVSLFTNQVLGFVESPLGCMKKESQKCYFGTVNKVSKLNLDEADFFLGKKTIIKKINNKTDFVEGELILNVASTFELYIESAQISLTKGEYFFRKIGDDFVVRTLDGIALVKTDKSHMQVTEGFEVSLVVKSETEPELSFSSLRVIPLVEHLRQYASVRQLSKGEIVSYTKKFSQQHRNYEIWFAELNEQLIQRQVAEEKAQQRSLDQKAIQKAKELAHVRQQLYKKVFER
jgi:hypothetical protein